MQPNSPQKKKIEKSSKIEMPKRNPTDKSVPESPKSPKKLEQLKKIKEIQSPKRPVEPAKQIIKAKEVPCISEKSSPQSNNQVVEKQVVTKPKPIHLDLAQERKPVPKSNQVDDEIKSPSKKIEQKKMVIMYEEPKDDDARRVKKMVCKVKYMKVDVDKNQEISSPTKNSSPKKLSQQTTKSNVHFVSYPKPKHELEPEDPSSEVLGEEAISSPTWQLKKDKLAQRVIDLQAKSAGLFKAGQLSGLTQLSQTSATDTSRNQGMSMNQSHGNAEARNTQISSCNLTHTKDDLEEGGKISPPIQEGDVKQMPENAVENNE